MAETKKQEQIIWSGHPSIYIFAGRYLIALVAMLFILQLEANLFPEHTYFENVFLLFYAFAGAYTGPSGMGVSLIAALLLQGVFWVIVGYLGFLVLQTKITTYTLTTEEIIIRYLGPRGLYTDHTELYRLVDFTLLQPIAGLIFGFSTLRVRSTDQSHPTIFLAGILDGKTVLRLVREQTEKCRVQKGVREFTSATHPC